MPGALLHHPLRDREPERAEAAGDEIGARTPVGRVSARLVYRQDFDCSDMTALPMCWAPARCLNASPTSGPSNVVARIGCNRSAVDAANHFLQQRSDQVGHARPTCGRCRWRSTRGLFGTAPGRSGDRRECRAVLRSRKRPYGRSTSNPSAMAGPASEFSTTSTPSPPVAVISSSANAVERESMTHRMPSGPQELALFLSAGRREDLGARLTRHLDRRESDTAAGGMDEHPLAGAEPSKLAQGVVRRHKRDRKGRGLFERERGRFRRRQPGIGDRIAAESTRVRWQRPRLPRASRSRHRRPARPGRCIRYRAAPSPFGCPGHTPSADNTFMKFRPTARTSISISPGAGCAAWRCFESHGVEQAWLTDGPTRCVGRHDDRLGDRLGRRCGLRLRNPPHQRATYRSPPRRATWVSALCERSSFNSASTSASPGDPLRSSRVHSNSGCSLAIAEPSPQSGDWAIDIAAFARTGRLHAGRDEPEPRRGRRTKFGKRLNQVQSAGPAISDPAPLIADAMSGREQIEAPQVHDPARRMPEPREISASAA